MLDTYYLLDVYKEKSLLFIFFVKTMELQNYLREQGLTSLCNEFKIKVNRHQNFTNLVCLKYSQLESPLEHKIVQQCRGIILNESQNWQIVSYPYNKFFNYGETQAANIDWDSSVVYDKLDGSLMILYYYQGEWRVQSSGTADGSGPVNIAKFSFQQLFWQVWQQLGYQLPEAVDYCFMFELMTPYNRIVVRQDKSDLVLHGVRNLKTLQEENPLVWANKTGWKAVTTYPLNNLAAIIKASETLDPMESEGYIVCDDQFNRLKIKSLEYVAISHMREGFSTRKLLNIVLTNEGEEFLNYYPEWKGLYNQIKIQYENLVQEITKTYRQYQDIDNQKDFALAIKHLPYAGTLFALRAKKVTSVKESLKNTSLTKLETLLNIDYLPLG